MNCKQAYFAPDAADNRDMLTAKAYCRGEIQLTPKEVNRLLIAAVEDRSNFISELEMLRERAEDVMPHFHPGLQHEARAKESLRYALEDAKNLLYPPVLVREQAS